MPTTSKGSDRTLRFIGAFKLLKGLLLMALAFGALRFLGPDPQVRVEHIIQRLSVDPGSRFFHSLATRVLSLSPRLPLIATGTCLYGVLFCVEGVGLLKRKRWAEWLAVIATGGFIPLEIYEMAKHQTVTKGVVLVLNIAIVIFLILRLRREKRPDRRHQTAPAFAKRPQSKTASG